MESNKLFAAMIRYNAGGSRQVQHFITVHSFARFGGLAEGLVAISEGACT